MEIKYTCTNHNCSYPGKNQYEICFQSESIMDANNVAATFCPFCKQEMMPSSPADIPGKPAEGHGSRL